MGAGGVRIEERTLKAIELGSDGNLNEALGVICPAIEATVRKHLNKPKISGSDFKDFLRKYYWLIERFGGEGVDYENTRFPNVNVESDAGKLLSSPDLADVIYHIFRCSLAHGFSIPRGFELIPTVEPGVHHAEISADGTTVRLPGALLWALIACVVFSRANGDIVTKNSVWLTWGGGPHQWRGELYRFDIDIFWGGEDVLRRFFGKLPDLKVGLNFNP